MNEFLIPANTKKSMLIFNLFNTMDLIIFLSGIGVTMFLLLILPVEDIVFAIISILPVAICGFLVLPVPNYHNVRTIIKSIWNFYSGRRVYYWKGWCIRDVEEQKKQ